MASTTGAAPPIYPLNKGVPAIFPRNGTPACPARAAASAASAAAGVTVAGATAAAAATEAEPEPVPEAEPYPIAAASAVAISPGLRPTSPNIVLGPTPNVSPMLGPTPRASVAALSPHASPQRR